jgi:hypothetical protein
MVIGTEMVEIPGDTLFAGIVVVRLRGRGKSDPAFGGPSTNSKAAITG